MEHGSERDNQIFFLRVKSLYWTIEKQNNQFVFLLQFRLVRNSSNHIVSKYVVLIW